MTAICITIMATALYLTAGLFTDYDLGVGPTSQVYNWFSVTVIGLYIACYVITDAALSTQFHPGHRLFQVIVGLLAGWVIVAGPLFGWTIMIGLEVSALVSSILTPTPSVTTPPMQGIALVVSPLVAGFLIGALVHFTQRSLTGQQFWDPRSKRELQGHCVGFALVIYISFYGLSGLGEDLSNLGKQSTTTWDYMSALWLIFIAAPLAHLARMSLTRNLYGAPRSHAISTRMLRLGLLLFFIAGAGRSLEYRDLSLLVTWPVKDFSDAMFWKDKSKRDT